MLPQTGGTRWALLISPKHGSICHWHWLMLPATPLGPWEHQWLILPREHEPQSSSLLRAERPRRSSSALNLFLTVCNHHVLVLLFLHLQHIRTARGSKEPSSAPPLTKQSGKLADLTCALAPSADGQWAGVPWRLLLVSPLYVPKLVAQGLRVTA